MEESDTARPTAHEEARRFYDGTYHKDARAESRASGHFRRLAAKVAIRAGEEVLDVGCGTGRWLLAARARGAHVAGVDVSQKAIEVCRQVLPDGEFHATPAESLPFADGRFHVVSCLGALEHFVDPGRALREIVRVARDDARFVISVPNAGFLTYRLGLFKGTEQAAFREEVKSLAEWKALFEAAGLRVVRRWRDLHVLSWSWISLRGWRGVPLRAAQALALAVWPLSWQFQVYHLCRKRRPGDD